MYLSSQHFNYTKNRVQGLGFPWGMPLPRVDPVWVPKRGVFPCPVWSRAHGATRGRGKPPSFLHTKMAVFLWKMKTNCWKICKLQKNEDEWTEARRRGVNLFRKLQCVPWHHGHKASAFSERQQSHVCGNIATNMPTFKGKMCFFHLIWQKYLVLRCSRDSEQNLMQ